MSNVITNSSTMVFTMYELSNKDDIKDLINAILAINDIYTFDDLFSIKMNLNRAAVESLYNKTSLWEKYESEDKLLEYLESLSDDEITEYEEMFWDYCESYYYEGWTFYSGYTISIKPEVQKTEILEKAVLLLNRLDDIFRHEYTYN